MAQGHELLQLLIVGAEDDYLRISLLQVLRDKTKQLGVGIAVDKPLDTFTPLRCPAMMELV